MHIKAFQCVLSAEEIKVLIFNTAFSFVHWKWNKTVGQPHDMTHSTELEVSKILTSYHSRTAFSFETKSYWRPESRRVAYESKI